MSLMQEAPSTVAALIVRADGTAEVRDVSPDLDSLAEWTGHPLVSDWSGGDWRAYAAEENPRDRNDYADGLLALLLGPDHTPPCGTLVLVGVGPDDSPEDVPADVLEHLVNGGLRAGA